MGRLRLRLQLRLAGEITVPLAVYAACEQPEVIFVLAAAGQHNWPIAFGRAHDGTALADCSATNVSDWWPLGSMGHCNATITRVFRAVEP